MRLSRRLSFAVSDGSSGWSGMSRLSKALSVLLMIAIMATATSIVYLAIMPHAGARFTEFYILGMDNRAEGYPKEAIAGETVSVILGIVNREQAKTNYRITVVIDGIKNSEIQPVTLFPDEKWEQVIKFVPTKVGNNQKVEFLLYRDEGTNPYLSLTLWIDVK
jgi:uncharacterized membrane protein